MSSISRRSQRDINIWPGFVDALATLLMVIIFLLMIFVIAQFFLNDALSGRDKALDNLNSQISELSQVLAMERRESDDLRLDLKNVTQQLQASLLMQDEQDATIRALNTRIESSEDKIVNLNQKLTSEREKSLKQVKEITDLVALGELLESKINALSALKAQLEKDIVALNTKNDDITGQLLSEKELSESARAELALLNQQMDALRNQLQEIAIALEASEEFNREQKVEIYNLGQRLNAALATKVQQLSKYRSDFFARLGDILGNTDGIQIVGDRFVLQSELLFEQGSADIGASGKIQMSRLATTLLELARKIPADIAWVLRVDGHTDTVPIYNNDFASNWELSTARAISVVKALISAGLPPRHLAATGFGQYQPLVIGSDPESLRRNRRIELKLTQR